MGVRLEPGLRLADGRYVFERRLGSGGMASVWLARDQRLERDVAVKVIADTLSSDDAWVRRFEREARAAAAVTHPHVVRVFDFGIEDGRPYLVMEYVAHGSLAGLLRERPAALEPERLARELLGALAQIHATGIVHRDIKPANILLDGNRSIRITDFGIARPEDATGLTETGVVLGTARYIAPEVLAGHPATPASDLYSAGVVLREAATKSADTAMQALIDALTREAPARRPPSAQAALQLIDAAPQRPVATPPPPPPPTGTTAPTRRLARTGRRRPAVLIAAAVAAVAVIAIAAATSGGGKPAETPLPASPARSAPLRAQLDGLNAQIRAAERPRR